jgi:hypothetical protein
MYQGPYTQRKLRSVIKLHSLRAELELEHYGREHLVSLSAKKRPNRSMPILLFIDGFGIHRNMYRSLKGFYITPANLSYSERRKISNAFTLTLGPHGANMSDVTASFKEPFRSFEKGIIMDINGIEATVNVFVMAFSGDMPQQAANGGFLSHNAEFGCRTCYCPSNEKGDLQYDVVFNGRYHHETHQKRNKGNAIAEVTRRNKYWTSKGLLPNTSPLEQLTPALDLILAQTYDTPHSEWKGLGKILHRLLNKSILTSSGLSRYVSAFQRFVTPVDWPHIQSPETHLKSWSMSECGRALILAPLILRCNADQSWFRSPFLHQAQLLLKPLDPSGVLSSVDLIVRAYALFADATFAVSMPLYFQVTDLHRIVLQGRDAFQRLIRAAKETVEETSDGKLQIRF